MIGSVVSKIGVLRRTGYSAAKHALAGSAKQRGPSCGATDCASPLSVRASCRTRSVNALGGDDRKRCVLDGQINKGLSAAHSAERIWEPVIWRGKYCAFVR